MGVGGSSDDPRGRACRPVLPGTAGKPDGVWSVVLRHARRRAGRPGGLQARRFRLPVRPVAGQSGAGCLWTPPQRAFSIGQPYGDCRCRLAAMLLHNPPKTGAITTPQRANDNAPAGQFGRATDAGWPCTSSVKSTGSASRPYDLSTRGRQSWSATRRLAHGPNTVAVGRRGRGSRMSRCEPLRLVVVAVALVALGGCSATAETKAGGTEPVTLRLAIGDPPGRPASDDVEEFARQVDDLSSGTLRVEITWEAHEQIVPEDDPHPKSRPRSDARGRKSRGRPGSGWLLDRVRGDELASPQGALPRHQRCLGGGDR